MPARRTFLALGAITVVLLGSVAEPRLAPAALVLDLLLVAAAVVDLRRARSAAIEAERRWPPLLIQGSRHAAETIVRSRAPRALSLTLRESLHPAIADGPRREALVVAPWALARWGYEIEPTRRGQHALGPLHARVLGPWGLAWSQRELLPAAPCRVYPQVRWEGEVGQLLKLAHRRELGQAPVDVQGGASEPYALREYRPGDPPVRIHWKASARHGRLISRDDTRERGGRLTILLDCARAMASADRRRSKLDHALAAALALVRVALGRGDRITLVAFSDRIERRLGLRSARDAAGAYRATFDLEARMAEPSYDLAAEEVLARETRRATVLLLTSVVDLAAAEQLREALLRLARRHRPVLVNLEDPELTALARGTPDTPARAFAKVSGLEILLANRSLARRLRRAGVAVATTPADALTSATLNAYLDAV